MTLIPQSQDHKIDYGPMTGLILLVDFQFQSEQYLINGFDLTIMQQFSLISLYEWEFHRTTDSETTVNLSLELIILFDWEYFHTINQYSYSTYSNLTRTQSALEQCLIADYCPNIKQSSSPVNKLRLESFQIIYHHRIAVDAILLTIPILLEQWYPTSLYQINQKSLNQLAMQFLSEFDQRQYQCQSIA